MALAMTEQIQTGAVALGTWVEDRCHRRPSRKAVQPAAVRFESMRFIPWVNFSGGRGWAATVSVLRVGVGYP